MDSSQESDTSSDDYSEEARDCLRSLRSREIMRTRSMSPNHFSTRKRKGLIKRSPLVVVTQEDSDEEENSGPKHLEDLPAQELEGAPPGWENHRRARGSSKNALPVAPVAGRRVSAFPTPGGATLTVRRPSENSQRRASQMTFDEWCQLKKFQEIHAAAQKGHQNSEDVDSEHLKNIKRNISFEEWSKSTQERHKRDIKEQEKTKLKEAEEKEAADMSKYKRRMSYDQWKLVKNATKFAIPKKGDHTVNAENDENEEERKKKAEEAHRKWAIKKELEEIKRDREMMLRMQNASLAVNDSNSNSPHGRRTSWIDANAALQVQTKKGKTKS